mmetsp:Transcript_29200/g.70446  ORF Transcript_29200/g.70446 Transcript_29200/m.70446 type:complete len:1095 (+) Transcript_29200:71-3355(+)
MGLSGKIKQSQVAILAILLNSCVCQGMLDDLDSNRIGLIPSQKPAQTPTKMPTFYPTEYPTIVLSKNTNIDSTGKPTLVVVDESTSAPTVKWMQNHGQSSHQSSDPAANAPSHKPSMKPSSPPTSSPSAAPSQSISTSPSGSPSLTDSTIPTSLPSLFPSPVPSKSSKPSMLESERPSTSTLPTSFPSSTPTQYPSAEHSDGPSQKPSIRPSVTPSRIPSQNPTISYRPTESISPSNRPSHSPSAFPSGLPTASGLPTLDPSRPPSDMPSFTPSTSGPSASPSTMPSSQPSYKPSLEPSHSPSTMPSSSPTLTCHDKADYRSPINGLTCLDHTGTDCYQWRNIGLNTSALGDLINNCPETCNIPCGAFLDFSIPVSYQLTGLPGLLDDLSKLSLEQVSFDYITDYVADFSEKVFELDTVELNSQSFGIHDERLLRRNLQQEINQQTKANQRVIRKEIVVVTVVFDGLSIGLDYDTISQLLVSGIKNAGFALALQGSDPFFKKAVISSAADTKDTTVHEPVDEEREGPSSATVLVSILGMIGIMATFMFAVANREKIEEWWIQKRLERFQSNSSDLDTSTYQGRPRIVSIDMIARGIPESNFERAVSRMKTVIARLRSNGSDGLQKMYGASSPRQNSASQASRLSHQGSPNNVASLLSFDHSTHTGTNASASNSIRRLITSITPTGSKSSTEPDDSSGSLEKGEKPLDPLRISSPMSEVSEDSNQPEHPLSKVIPPMIVIDNIDDGTLGEADKKTEPKMVPGKCLQASTEIKSALTGQSTARVMMLNFPEFNAWQNYDEIPHSLSPLGLVMDSESETGTSCASTPANSVTQKSELSRFGALGGSEFETPDPVFSPLHLLAMQSSSSASETTFDFANDAADDVSIELMMTREPSSQENSGHERVGLINSIWAMSPSNAMKETLMSAKKGANAKSQIFKRRFSNSSDIPGDVDRSENLTKESNRFMFEAPRTSKLGLEIDSRDDSGPFVHAVKDYSPLFGQIKTGDKICEIDGRDQQGSNPREVMQLLSAKHRRRVSSGSMRIVVERSASVSNQSTKPSNSSNDANHFERSSEATSNQNYEDIDSMISSMLWSHKME